ncbi:ATP-binding protein [Natrinema sp. H-ect1]|uniref:ATP-binding protein n=1 Tax=Natrinema sp. H-ect1 TaxID=3242700 RepID=UPI00359D3ED4
MATPTSFGSCSRTCRIPRLPIRANEPHVYPYSPSTMVRDGRFQSAIGDRNRSEGDGSSLPGVRSAPRPRGARRHRRGLALCRHIAERHDGAITVDSETGGGAAVSVALPTTPNHDLSDD